MTRLRSLDVFRGLTVAAMVIVNNPGDWSTVYWPLLHAEWNGWTPTDLIFPFFLFIVGTSIGLGTRHSSVATIVRRGAIIWGLGLFMAAYPFFRLSTVRIPGVLARIAWCYVATALVARAVAGSTERRRIVRTVVVALLSLYWILLAATPFPGGVAGDLSPEGNIGAWLDRAVFGAHLWRGGQWDPEGLLSSIPAVATTMIGLIAGWFIAETTSPFDSAQGRPRAIVRGLLVWGLFGIVLGLFTSQWLPINKNLWTSSYVLFTGGLAAAALAVSYWLCDARESPLTNRATEPLVALGRNAILLFVLSGLVAKTLIYLKWPDESQSLGSWIYRSAFVPLASPYNASLLYAVANLAALYALLAYLHRRRRYLTV